MASFRKRGPYQWQAQVLEPARSPVRQTRVAVHGFDQVENQQGLQPAQTGCQRCQIEVEDEPLRGPPQALQRPPDRLHLPQGIEPIRCRIRGYGVVQDGDDFGILLHRHAASRSH